MPEVFVIRDEEEFGNETEGTEDAELEGKAKRRMETAISYVRPRDEFGRPTFHFKAVGPLTLVERRPDQTLRDGFVKKNPVPVSTQYGVDYSEHELVTEKTKYISTVVGPRSKDDFYNESEVRRRKKLMKEESLLEKIPDMQKKAERWCIQNSCINIYESYFQPPNWEEPLEYKPIDLRVLNKYPDFCEATSRPIQCIKMEPFDCAEVAAAYGFLTYRRKDYITDCQSYIWNLETPREPIMTLEPTFPAIRLDYNSKLPHILLGGLITGQLCYWDLRVSGSPVAFSGLHTTFREPPSGCLWIQAKNGYECFATSADGQVIWYDVRNFDEPIETVILDFKSNAEPNISNSTGASALEFEQSIPTKFMVGLETGSVLVGNRKGKTLQEKFSTPYYAFSCPIRSLVRNPSNLKCFLCVGDYAFKIFAEDCKESYIFWSKAYPCWLTTGKWSPSKHSVFYITRKDGSLDVWDLLQNFTEPVLNEKLSSKPLRCCEIHESGKLVMVGGDNGTVQLLSVSSHFFAQDKNERSLIAGMLERESKREKLIDSRNREVRLQQRQRGTMPFTAESQDEKLKAKTREDFIKSLSKYDVKKRKTSQDQEEE